MDFRGYTSFSADLIVSSWGPVHTVPIDVGAFQRTVIFATATKEHYPPV